MTHSKSAGFFAHPVDFDRKNVNDQTFNFQWLTIVQNSFFLQINQFFYRKMHEGIKRRK